MLFFPRLLSWFFVGLFLLLAGHLLPALSHDPGLVCSIG
jgi:hypothetical protein